MDFSGKLLYDVLIKHIIFLETILYWSDSELVYRISEILCFQQINELKAGVLGMRDSRLYAYVVYLMWSEISAGGGFMGQKDMAEKIMEDYPDVFSKLSEIDASSNALYNPNTQNGILPPQNDALTAGEAVSDSVSGSASESAA